MSERETDRTAPWMLNHCANLKHGTVQSGVLVSACDWCAKYADPLCAMARPGGPDDHDWPAGCSCARRHNVAAPVVSRAAGGETEGRAWSIIRDAMMRACRAEREEQTTERFIAMIDAFAAKCEQELRALSSAPAPEERHRRFAEAVNRRISYNVDGSSVYVEFRSERDAVLFEEAMRGCDRHPDPDFRPVPASPSGAGSPVAREDFIAVLDKGGVAITTRSPELPTFEEDRAELLHTFNATDFPHHHPFTVIPLYRAAPPAAGREPSEDQRDAARVLIETFAGRTDDAFVCDLVDGPFKRPDGQMLNVGDIRAALGASAQTNTGEAR